MREATGVGACVHVRRWLVRCAVWAVVVAGSNAWADGDWEMRVCAHPNNPPFSSESMPGFDNRIAKLLADELGGRAEFVWKQTGGQTPRQELWPGNCDVVVGVGQRGEGMATTVPYYRSPFVFVFRSDRGLEIGSLEDEDLQGLTLSTYPNGVVDRNLKQFDLRDQVTYLPPIEHSDLLDYDTPVLEAVESGEVDVGILYGPVAGHYAKHESDVLEVTPVEPLLLPPQVQMFRYATIGVRPGDEDFRDRLNRALAARWDEIQAVLDEYGVPTLGQAGPSVRDQADEETLRIGAVLPLPTGEARSTDVLGRAGEIGARVAENVVGGEADDVGVRFQVKVANGPSEAAVRRAANRLVTTEGVVALVGGITERGARVLRDVAEARDVLFFNIGSLEDELRGDRCASNTFHIEASASMYLDGTAMWFGGKEHDSWFAVHQDTQRGRQLLARSRQAFEGLAPDLAHAGSSSVQPGQLVFTDVGAEVDASDASVVLLLMPSQQQEAFLSQFSRPDEEMALTGLPYPIMQTRAFWVRLRQVGGGNQSDTRMALWDTTLQGEGARDLIASFTGRSSLPMDPVGWSMYAAAKVVFGATQSTDSEDAAEMRAFLESEQARFELGKGVDLSFRDWDHQLRQPLYAVRSDPSAEWGRELSKREAIATVAGVLPDDREGPGGDGTLDLLGDGPTASECSW